MRLDRKRLPVLLGMLVGLVAILILATGISELELEPGRPLFLPNPGGEPQTGSQRPAGVELDGTLHILLTILFLVVTPISIIYVILNPKSWKRILKNVAIVVLIMLSVFAFTSIFQNLARDGGELEFSGEQSAEVPLSDNPFEEINIDPPSWIGFLTGFIILALILGIGLLVWLKRRSDRDEGELERIVEGAEEALADLRSGADLRDTVVRCYREMSETMSAQRGVYRMRAMTAREFQLHLASVGFRDEHIDRLTRLFERVRYGDQSTQPEMEQEARDCLEAIVKTYASAAS